MKCYKNKSDDEESKRSTMSSLYRRSVLFVVIVMLAIHSLIKETKLQLQHNYDGNELLFTRTSSVTYNNNNTNTNDDNNNTINKGTNQQSFKEEKSSSKLISPACRPYYYLRNNRTTNDVNNDHFYRPQDNKNNNSNGIRPTKIEFRHMRKAGGTHLVKYLQKVIKSNQTSYTKLHSCEGHKQCLQLNHYDDGFHRYYKDEQTSTKVTKYGRNNRQRHTYLNSTSKHYNNENEQWDYSGDTLYVTHIREPIARAISHYKYSERWSCLGDEQLLKNRKIINQYRKKKMDPTQIPLHKLKFIPTKENQRYTFNEFMYGMKPIYNMPNQKGQFNQPQANKLWACSTNCFSRWITGMYHPQDADNIRNTTLYNITYPNSEYYYHHHHHNNNNTEQGKLTNFGHILKEESYKLFYRYDLIIVLEWLRDDPIYARSIEDMYFNGVRGLSTLFSATNGGGGIKKQTIPQASCDNESKLANYILPMEELSDKTKDILKKRNDIDINLYNTLTAC